MSILNRNSNSQGESRNLDHDTSPQSEQKGGHEGHGHWIMIACCVPMLAIAIALVATGVVGAGFILVAVMCTAMMAAMMIGMSGTGR